MPGTLVILSLFACGPEDDTTPSTDATTWYVDPLEDGQTGSGTAGDPYRLLQQAIESAADGDTLLLLAGTHRAEVVDWIDPTCGNCEDADFRVDIPISLGFHIAGKVVHIRGDSRTDTILETGAGYGVLFENAGSSSIENLTITGGVRDADGQATDAAIVVRHTELLVQNVTILDNNDLYTGDPDPVVGLIGIAGREGAVLTVVGCTIENTSWDGIALYRGDPEIPGSSVVATIVDNTIGCSEDCVFYNNGRGVGIGVTWDAQATIVNNRVHDFWKGIGSFGTSQVEVHNNIVEDQYGWGIIASGYSHMTATNNVVARTGNTGMAAWDATPTGSFVNNIVTGSGWVDEWVGLQTGVWMNATGDFTLAYNDIWDNTGENVCTGGYPGTTACTPIAFEGIDGNLSVDPLWVDDLNYALDDGSPLIDQGHPEILDTDGSRSDLGVHGGPAAGSTTL
jgi:hypothetical protein